MSRGFGQLMWNFWISSHLHFEVQGDVYGCGRAFVAIFVKSSAGWWAGPVSALLGQQVGVIPRLNSMSTKKISMTYVSPCTHGRECLS